MSEYGFTQELDMSFEAALEKVKARLKDEGFGVLTTIDVQEKFREKLDVDFKKYVILGACNPGMAHQALEAEENIGLMLPCNVIVYEKASKTLVAAIRPTVAMRMIDNADLQRVAEKVEQSLQKIVGSLILAPAAS
jgi:uncharacterized protein (DUF302 family)